MNKKNIIYFILLAVSAIGIIALVLDIGDYFESRSERFQLPQLPYAYDALEPYIDTETMKIHHTKHHQAYTDNLNKTLEKYPDLLNQPIEKILENLNNLPEKIRTDVQNFGGGYYNHNFFWAIMSPNGGGEPQGELLAAINKDFGSFIKFKEQFNAQAKKLFGSGWTWLVLNKDNKLEILNTQNQDSPISFGLKPLLCLDVWEHAYYLKYQNRRIDFIDAWWFVVNWNQVSQNYENLS